MRRVFLVLVVLLSLSGLGARPALAQGTGGLAGLLLRFFSEDNPVVLAENPNPAFSHAAHFRSQENAQGILQPAQRRDRHPDLDLPGRHLVGRLHLHVRRDARRLQPHDPVLRPDLRRAAAHRGEGQVQLRRQLPARHLGSLRGAGPRRRRPAALPDPRGLQPGRLESRPLVRGGHHPGRPRHRPEDGHHGLLRELRADGAPRRRRRGAAPAGGPERPYRHFHREAGDLRRPLRRSPVRRWKLRVHLP